MKSEFAILLVDDEANVLRSLKRLFFDLDCKIKTAPGGEEGLQLLCEQKFQLVISDFRMPGMDGVEFLSKVKEKYPDTIRIVLSGYADAGAMMEAINEGEVYKFIPKPWDDQNLLTTVKEAFEMYRLQQENKSLYKELSEKYDQLQDMNKLLEDKVSERTEDLEIKNRALMIAQNILNCLPVGVIGIDALGNVAYLNNAVRNYESVKTLMIGQPLKGHIDSETGDILADSIKNSGSSCSIIRKNNHETIICTSLEGNRGAIGVVVDSSNLGRSSDENGNVEKQSEVNVTAND